MSASDAPARSKRNWLAAGAFVALAATLVGMKCLCPDPAAAMRQQVTGSAEIRGAPLRAAVATPAPESRPREPSMAAVEIPAPAPAKPDAAQATRSVPPADAAPDVASVPTPSSEPRPAARAAASPAPTAATTTAPAATPRPEIPPKSEPPAAAPPVSAPAKAAAAVAGPPEAATYKAVTWDDISKYTYVPPEPGDDDASPAAQANAKTKSDQIPADIRALSGKRLSIEGYAVPLEFEKGVVRKFILLNAPLACCFAEAPPMNRWMMVTNAGKTEFDYGKYNVLRVSGTFDVGEETREGYVIGIYRMKAEKIANVVE